jgi:S1-C subfamily serine protease
MAQQQEPWDGYHAGLPAPPPPPPTARRRAPFVILGIVVLAASVLIGTLVDTGGGSGTSPNLATMGGTTGTTAKGSVVDINTSAETLGSDGLRPLGAGTGMVLTADGEILTNNHVVAGASGIEVSIPGLGNQTATVVGVDPTDDVALLQLNDVSGLSPVTLGDSSEVQVGDTITAIGNAFGAPGPPTTTTGTVTAVHRSIVARDPAGGSSERLDDVIQISADVHPGDSGGALLNADGQVIGIITAGPSNSTTGIGFAIPIDAAKNSVAQLIKNGRVTYAYVGITTDNMTPSLAKALGYKVDHGALIVDVNGGSPGADAHLRGGTRFVNVLGLQELKTGGDVIVAIDGHPVASADDVVRIVSFQLKPRDTAVFTIVRDGQQKRIPVRLEERRAPSG